MKTLLVLGPQPELAAAIHAVLDPERYRLIPRDWMGEAESALRQGLIDACIIDAELTNVQPTRMIEQVHRLVPNCPILVFTSARQREWEEDAYLAGATHVLVKPVRAQLLNTLLDRLWISCPSTVTIDAVSDMPADIVRPASSPEAGQTLAVMRHFSSILSNSLCSEALSKQFLLFLREILRVNRAAIFLRSPVSLLTTAGMVSEDRRLRSAYAIGLAPGLLEYLTLSLEGGIGGYLFRKGRILRKGTDEAHRDREIQTEFELLGVQVAIPILDRESLVGMAVFDGRLTGEPFANDELSLVFHLLEQFGLAMSNIWLHDKLRAGHQMMTDVLSQLNCGCVVISHKLEVIHCNRAARSLLSPSGEPAMEFNLLPQILSSKVYEALTKGQELPPFLYRVQDHSERVYRVAISPFCRHNSNTPNAVLMVVEDYTLQERSQRLEIESTTLRLVKTMAERLAHEIGNSLVPLSTHQQLAAQKIDDPDFRLSLTKALTEGVSRISRLSKQMVFLAQDMEAGSEAVPVALLLEEAYAVAQNHCLPHSARMLPEISTGTHYVLGDRNSLKHALAEIFLNAFQANPVDPVAVVRVRQDCDTQNHPWIQFEVEDSGPGFTAEMVEKAQQPFFSTRNVGLGLGLTVARKIIEAHHGKLILMSSERRSHGIVRLSLPSLQRR